MGVSVCVVLCTKSSSWGFAGTAKQASNAPGAAEKGRSMIMRVLERCALAQHASNTRLQAFGLFDVLRWRSVCVTLQHRKA